MLDMRVIRQPQMLYEGNGERGTEVPLDELLELDSQSAAFLQIWSRKGRAQCRVRAYWSHAQGP